MLLGRHLVLIQQILLALLELHGLGLGLLVVLAAVSTVGLVLGASQVRRDHVFGNFLIYEIGSFLAGLLRRTLELLELLTVVLVLFRRLLVSRLCHRAVVPVELSLLVIVVVWLSQTVLVETFAYIAHNSIKILV